VYLVANLVLNHIYPLGVGTAIPANAPIAVATAFSWASVKSAITSTKFLPTDSRQRKTIQVPIHFPSPFCPTTERLIKYFQINNFRLGYKCFVCKYLDHSFIYSMPPPPYVYLKLRPNLSYSTTLWAISITAIAKDNMLKIVK
jgi:hypothetical protein